VSKSVGRWKGLALCFFRRPRRGRDACAKPRTQTDSWIGEAQVRVVAPRPIQAPAEADGAKPDFEDQPPQTSGLTDYDRTHPALYARILDAEEEGPTGPRWFAFSLGSIQSAMPSVPVASTTAIFHARSG
jgi:hypothetical protein